MDNEEKDKLAADYEYKRAITTFLKEGGGVTLKTLAVQLTIFNRNLPLLLDEMKLLRGAIDRMPRR